MYNQNLVSEINDIINQAEKFRNAYFWDPKKSAGARRATEKRESRPQISWLDGNDVFTAEFIVSCTCSYTKARGIYTRNGKRTTLTAIKNSAKRMENLILTK